MASAQSLICRLPKARTEHIHAIPDKRGIHLAPPLRYSSSMGLSSVLWPIPALLFAPMIVLFAMGVRVKKK